MSLAKNRAASEKSFAGIVVYVIATKREDRPDCNSEDHPCVYDSVADAEYVLEQMSPEARAKRTIRVASPEERKTAVLVHPKRKTVRGACLVELFEDLDSRKFAISSKAENRGYKADKVQTRMFLIAGDLEIPTLQVDAVHPQALARTG